MMRLHAQTLLPLEGAQSQRGHASSPRTPQVPAAFSCRTPRLLVVDSDHSHARSATHMHSPVSCQCTRPPLPPAHDPRSTILLSIQTTATHVLQLTCTRRCHASASARRMPPLLRRISLSTRPLLGRGSRTASIASLRNASGAAHLVRDRRAIKTAVTVV